MIEFPSNPTDGQQYTSGDRTWKWVAASSTWDMVPVGTSDAQAAASAATAAATARDKAKDWATKIDAEVEAGQGYGAKYYSNLAATTLANKAENADLASTVDAAKGAGRIGFAAALAYAAGTLGAYVKSLVTTAGLAAASTVAIGGFSTAETQSILDEGLPMQSYAAMGAYTGRATGIRITTPGIAGAFRYNAALANTSNGGTQIAHASGTGAWERLATGDWSVKWFGAKGDNATDDTTAVNAALTASVGRVLVFDPGTYIVDGTLLRVYSLTTVRGYGATLKLKAGNYTTTRYFFGTNTGITYDSNYAETSFVDIAGITLDGNIANVTTTDSCYGINAYRTRSFFVSDVKIKDLPGVVGVGYGIAFSYSTDVMASRVNINRTDRQNIIVWETKNARIDGCTLKDSYFRDCILVSSSTPAVYQASECNISNSECRNTMSTGTHVIRFSGESGGKMSNLRLYGYQSGGAGLHGIYITDIYPKRIVAENVSINDCFRGVDISSDAAHVLEFIGLQIGMETACYDGFRANTDGAVVKVNGGSIKATNQVLYMNAVDFQSVVGVELIGGTQNSAIFSESAGVTVFNSNTVRGNTNASYPVLFGGAGEPIIIGNKVTGNTVNTLRATTGAIAAGNNSVTIDGVARAGGVTKRSTTANRPTLTASDIMVPYMDTTLVAAGKPIWWTGTAWVDATGTAV